MSYNRFKGTGVAMITPFKADKSVDFRAFENLIESLIRNQVDYLLVMGTTAESVTLSEEEKNEIIETAIRVNAGRVPLMLGLGGNCTENVVKAIKKQNFDGIDAILSVTPYYNKPNQEGLYLHYSEIAKASPVPVMLYNVPGRTGINMKSETVLRLAQEHKNIFGIKEASGDIIQIMDLIKNRPNGFLVVS